MNVLIVKNVKNEGPGTIEDFLRGKGMEYTVIDFSGCEATEEIIPEVDRFTHLVIMGGPMAVYESVGFPFLHYEVAMIRVFILSGKAVLGICLGAQMIAHALKADVYSGGTEEAGWGKVDITQEGMDDPVFSCLSVNNEPYAEVFQWHGDTFDLPKKAVRMALSGIYQNQAFRYGSNVYGLQFHIEATKEMIYDWFNNTPHYSEKLRKETEELGDAYRLRAMKFYEVFFGNDMKNT